MQWFAIMMCLYAGVASARTEEDQQTSSSTSIIGISDGLLEQCFYRQSSECPDVKTTRCSCKKIVLAHNNPEGNAVLCCNLDVQNFDSELSCAGYYKIILLTSEIRLFY